MSHNLKDAFKGMDAEEHRIQRILMVGAHPHPDGKRLLSLNDRSLLRLVVSWLEQNKLPISEAIRATLDFQHDPATTVIRPICILEEYGGEDFLKSEEKADVIVFCNIAKEDKYSETGLAPLRKSFKSADNHDDMVAWNAQILKSEAKIVCLFGSDGFDVEDFNASSFIRVKTQGVMQGILVNRAFFGDAGYFLLEQNSPLIQIIPHYDDPAVIFMEKSDKSAPYGRVIYAEKPSHGNP